MHLSLMLCTTGKFIALGPVLIAASSRLQQVCYTGVFYTGVFYTGVFYTGVLYTGVLYTGVLYTGVFHLCCSHTLTGFLPVTVRSLLVHV